MNENWIEDVLMDLSKSAFNEGRMDLCMAIDELVKVAGASSHEAQKEDIEIGSIGFLGVCVKLPKADVVDFLEYRKKLKIRQLAALR